MTNTSNNLVVKNKKLSTQTTPLQSLLSNEVSRSQFLKLSALGIFSILGLSTIIHFLTGKQTNVTKIISTTSDNSSTAYGNKIKAGKK